ncbi:hypothetical protein FIU87_12950 [Bacillus sp. THAF10]|nr:hypothetical protein [Bacillus sp. THAF10]QFT89561.1 hypothetical protein FIU87_12950 [Bacillus sp. THAF10]
MKKWLLAIGSSVLVLAFATGCAGENNNMNNDTNTEQNESNTGETNEE